MPTVTIELTDMQIAALQEASPIVHGKPIKGAVMAFLRFTVHEYRTRQAAATIEQQVKDDGFPVEEET